MKKNIITAVVLLALISLFVGCRTLYKPVTTFDGNVRDTKEIASLYYDQPTVLHLGLFKVDGKISESRTLIYNSGGYYDIDIQLLPGKHELEIVLGHENKVQTITSDFKAGSKYELLYEDKKLSLVELINGKQIPVNFQLRDIPEYKEPSENEPHAVLLEEGDTRFMGGMGWIKYLTGELEGGLTVLDRIDGQHGNAGWGMYISFRDSGNTFKRRLKPGIHTLDFYFNFDDNYTKMHSMKFNFEAGKKYTLFCDTKNQYVTRLIEVK